MDRRSEFISKITDFPPLSPEANESLFSKFFKFARSPPSEGNENNQPDALSDGTSQDASWKDIPQDENKEPVDLVRTEEFPEGRSLQNVLKRISSLIALKSASGPRYADTERARYWIPDSVSRECYECGARFGAFRRRHHCRVCGQIFCARCCSHRVPGHVCGCAGGLRVCTYCCRVVLGYLQDGGTALSADLRALQEGLQAKLPKETDETLEQSFLLSGGMETSVGGTGGAGNSMELGLSDCLQDSFRGLCLALPLQQHRYRLIRYTNVWRGGDILQWLIDHGCLSNRFQATAVCQAMISEGLLECVTEQQTFTDYALYKPVNLPVVGDTASTQSVMTGSTSSYCLNLNVAENSAHLVRGQRSVSDVTTDSLNSDVENPIPLHTIGGDATRTCCSSVIAAGAEHLQLLLVQGLARAGLNLSWASVLLPLCQQAANMIHPDVSAVEWDVRRCVRVKRVPGGEMRESRALSGVVFSKNVAHRGMPARLNAPRLLLLRCSLDYQRVEGKLVSLEPVIMQEQEHLRHCCARVVALQPDVVLVQGSVSRLAQDELRKRGVTLVLNVRPSVMQRVARCTSADIVTSVDAHIGRPKLGLCKAFYLLNYDSKTLMVLEGYASDLKACSVILRGATLEELGRVKRVASLILLAAYNWRLESSLLGDMGATLPISSASLMFTDNSKDNSPETNESQTIKEKIPKEVTVNDSNFGIESSKKSAMLLQVEKSKGSGDLKANGDIPGKEAKLSIAITDPLTTDQYLKVNKRVDGERGLSCGITVDDFSDPLRAHTQHVSAEDEVFLPVMQGGHFHDSDSDTLRNRWSTDEAVLSMSPHVRICAPYLESEAGRRCPLRQFYRHPLFPGRVPAPPTPRHRRHSVKPRPEDLSFKEAHPFVTKALVQSSEGSEVRALLANYRATGSRLRHENVALKKTSLKVSTAESAKSSIVPTPADPLDPEQHQRMHLLFYSYSTRSANAPDFCINPWIVRMEMYGNNDIPLGLFLERHCFAQQNPCTSNSCQIPLVQHVRKFVHGDGCIMVTCGTVESSTTRGAPQRLPVDEEGKQSVMWWCRCTCCTEGGGGGGGGACLRPPSLALSLAKYLELRLHAPRYTRTKSCHHSINQEHAHYFACGNTTACFRYSKIKSWDICLPPLSIATHHNTRATRLCLINQVKDLVLKENDVFGNIGDGECEKEHALFKQHVDQIQYNLTSTSLQEQCSNAGVVRWLWSISDALIIGEKMLQDTHDKWTAQTSAKSGFKLSQDIIDGKLESDDPGQPDFHAVDCVADSRGLASNSIEIDHTGEEEEDKGDKRGLRAMLSQLLTNSQPAHRNGVFLCDGVVPVVVLAGEVSSLVAAALASLQYHNLLVTASHTKGAASDTDEKENAGSGAKDKSENEGKSKNSKNHEHIDVQLHKDGLSCRVFHAMHFVKLRAMLLCPLQCNSHIENDFSLKPDHGDSEIPNSDKTTDLPTDGNQKDTLVDHPVSHLTEKDISIGETSPAMGLKRSSEKKASIGKIAGNGIDTLSEIEESFIRSLSRCIPWAARGGKSGSTFCKTKDDRYILKEMSKMELQLFMDFAPSYFNYIQSCHQNNLPTLLGRIVGVYQVEGVEGVGSGVLVMENLWHGRTELARRFDLKGARRNRLAEQGPPDVVLLDENLLNLRWESPLYLQSHSAGVLSAAVKRDTDFLSTHQIMDYSLLVGLDEERQELVLGIIDYIRTFTWDKKLEHIVKKGLGSGLPTIVSPEQYKARFCNAMRKYFLQSPNQWEDLDRGLISDFNLTLS